MAVVQMEPADLAAGSFAVPMGPMASLPLSVFAPGVEYEFSARLRLMTTGRGEGGTPPSACSRGVTDSCPYLALQRRVDFASPWDYKRLGPQTPSPAVDGTWYEYSFRLNFTEHLPDLASYGERYVYFQGAEAGVDVALVDFDVREFVPPPPPPPSTWPSTGPTAIPVALLPCMDNDFETADHIGYPLAWYGGEGTARVEGETDPGSGAVAGNSYFVTSGRDYTYQGPKASLPLSCLAPGVEYEISARLRLTTEEGGGETTSACSRGVTESCPYLSLQRRVDSNSPWDYKGLGPKTLSPADRTWYEYSFRYNFAESLPDLSSYGERNIYFQGAEAGVDVALDDFVVREFVPPPPPSPLPEGTCLDDDFEYEFADYHRVGGTEGWTSNGGATPVLVAESAANNTYLKVSGRTGSWIGPRIRLPVSCLEAGVKYEISARLRLTKDGGSSASNCTAGIVERCPTLSRKYRESSGDPTDFTSLQENLLEESPADGAWHDVSFPYKFTAAQLELPVTSTGFHDLFFQGPEPGVDIDVDDVRIAEAPPLEWPVVTADTSSAVVVLPEPPAPGADALRTGSDRTDCPHLQVGLLRWHEESTWGGSAIPGDGDDVTLPAGASVLVDSSISGVLGTITVPAGSALVVGENPTGIDIHARGMEVRGKLTIGSESCRIESSVTLTLHGTRPTDLDIHGRSDTATSTYKGIAVMGGTLSLHGKRYYRTWTRLARTARPGDAGLHLMHRVNWEAGQEAVLVTTALKDSRDWHQNEIVTVVSVTDDDEGPGGGGGGSFVRLSGPVSYTHLANPYYQAEVGLLSRTIAIQGSEEDSQDASDIDDGTFQDTRWVYGSYLAPNPNKNLKGFGGHIQVTDGGVGYVEGVELYRMGQTNVLGRYPMHFHVLGNSCADCYFRDSSVHQSFYRCVSIHGTHNITVSENVAYDITGYCYYLEDGIEEDNTLSFNLAALIHFLGKAPYGDGQQIKELSYQSADMILPADSTASGFYITNVHNRLIGNSASGGWAGYAFPVLKEPLGPHRNINMRPSSRTSLEMNGNTGHSSGWWWSKVGPFYFGGHLYYGADNLLVYNAGRGESGSDTAIRLRHPCLVDKCAQGDCDDWCSESEQAWLQLRNTKAFLTAGSALNSWSGRMEILGFEAHDMGLAIQALEAGFWIDNLHATCRSGEDFIMPSESRATFIPGNGFVWYDTGQEHIMTNSTFLNCGYRQSPSNSYDQYDTSPLRGCYNDRFHGCSDKSSVFGLLTHSDEFNPEVMQATKQIMFDNCGRRFKLNDFRETSDFQPPSSVSGRIQNWLDIDGSLAPFFNEPALIGSGVADAGMWWAVESDVYMDTHGPLVFIKKNSGPHRGLGHITLAWDESLHDAVGDSICGNGDLNKPCDPVGYIKHMGPMFEADSGLPVTAQPDIAGPVGGFGWLLSLSGGAPVELKISRIEVNPDTPLVVRIQYPLGANITIRTNYPYIETLCPKASLAEVWHSSEFTYHLDSNGFLTFRLIMAPNFFTRDTISLPRGTDSQYVTIKADCTTTNGVYCEMPASSTPVTGVCSSGYTQVAYDKCCTNTSQTDCQIMFPPPSHPASSSLTNSTSINLVSDPGFEGGCGRTWYPVGEATLSQDSYSHSGSYSMLVSDRTATWHGVGQDLKGVLDPGMSYRFSCWVKLKNSASDSFKFTLYTKTMEGVKDWKGATIAVNNSTWTNYVGTETLPEGTFDEVVLFAEKPAAGVHFFIDDVSVMRISS